MYLDQRLTIDTNKLKVDPIIIKNKESFSIPRGSLYGANKKFTKKISPEKQQQIETLYQILDPDIQENLNLEDFKSWVLKYSYNGK